MHPWIPTTLTLLAWLYAGALGGYLLWTGFHLPRPWWLRALSTVSFWLFLPILALPLTIPLVPSLGYGLAAACGALLFASHYLWPMIPRRPLARAAGSDLKVMSANLLKYNVHADEIAETIAAEQADIVALQELKPEHIRAIEERLATIYPYRHLYPGEDCEGMGLLSRYPFLSVELHKGEPGTNPTQVARVRLPEREAWIVNVHPRIPRFRLRRIMGLPIPYDYDTSERRADVEEIVRLVEGLEGNALLLGDLNTTPECAEYRLIPRRWRDAHREAGWGPGLTFPVKAPFLGVYMPFPLFRLDYVFYTGSWRALHTRTGTMPGSDHRYLIVELH